MDKLELNRKTRDTSRVDQELLQKGIAGLPKALGMFGFTSYRKGQDTIISNLIAGRDTIGLLPTGHGKSQTFIAPTLALDFKTIIFSPLIALIKDQCEKLQRMGIASAQISSATESLNSLTYKRWAEGEIQFLFVAPERLRNEMFLAATTANPPDMLVVDECFTGDVEILTSKGFVPFKDLEEDVVCAQFNADTEEVSFVKPSKIINKPYEGDMIHLHSKRGVDLSLTPNHRLLAYRRGKRYKKVSASNFKGNTTWYFKTAAKYEGWSFDSKLPTLDKFKIAFQADGSFHGGNRVLFSFTKERKIKRFLAICMKLGFKYSNVKSIHPEKIRYTVDVKDLRLSKQLDEMFDLASMSKSYARDFVAETSKWDGSDLRVRADRNMLYYSSTLERNTSFVQSVSVLAGFKAYMSIQNDVRKSTYKDVYRLFINLNKTEIGTQQVKSTTKSYKGRVYCVKVPDGNIIVRRNGKPVVTGNCHTIDQWADSFRPAYTKIGPFIESVDPRLVLCLTATATPEVESTIRRVIGIPNADKIAFLPKRENLRFTSREWVDDEELLHTINSIDGPVIVYCATKKVVESTHKAIGERITGSAHFYHGGLSPSARDSVQDYFMSGQVRVIFATNAFGMGIDKDNVRGVIHRHLPGSIEALVQETGRAGRDGEEALCVTYRCRDSIRIQEYFIDGQFPPDHYVKNIYSALVSNAQSNPDGRTTLSQRELEGVAGVPPGAGMSVLAFLESQGVINKVKDVVKSHKVKIIIDHDNKAFKRYMDYVEENGHMDDDGFYDVDMEDMSAELGISEQTIRNKLREWSRMSQPLIMYLPPLRTTPIEVVKSITEVDFTMLRRKHNLAHSKLAQMQTYFDLPESEKSAYLTAYFKK